MALASICRPVAVTITRRRSRGPRYGEFGINGVSAGDKLSLLPPALRGGGVGSLSLPRKLGGDDGARPSGSTESALRT